MPGICQRNQQIQNTSGHLLEQTKQHVDEEYSHLKRSLCTHHQLSLLKSLGRYLKIVNLFYLFM